VKAEMLANFQSQALDAIDRVQRESFMYVSFIFVLAAPTFFSAETWEIRQKAELFLHHGRVLSVTETFRAQVGSVGGIGVLCSDYSPISHAQAESFLKGATELDRDNWEAFNALGDFLRNTNKPQLSLDAFMRSVALKVHDYALRNASVMWRFTGGDAGRCAANSLRLHATLSIDLQYVKITILQIFTYAFYSSPRNISNWMELGKTRTSSTSYIIREPRLTSVRP